MQIEQVKPNKPSFGLVVALFAATIILIFIAAWIILAWREHRKEKAPYSKHPVALVGSSTGGRLAA